MSSSRVVLSRSPYMGRTRSRQDIETVLVGFRSKEREGNSIKEQSGTISAGMSRSELEARLLAVCDSLEAKTVQCKFLMHENEQLSNRLIELSKGMVEPDNLSLSSQMAHSHTITNVKEQSPLKEVRSVQLQTEWQQKSNDR